jgi:phage terminase large subunit-like protein
MIEGESGLLSIFPTHQRPLYEPSKRRMTFHNGSIATTYSAEEPDRLRGPQHDGAWADELCAWKYPETWDQLQFGLRLGTHPRQVVSTTPRPTKQLRELIADPRTVVTRGRTLDNASNLAPAFIAALKAKYEGTRLGRQEMDAEILDDNPGALWQRSAFDATRVSHPPMMRRVVVAIDPAVTSTDNSDETGIVVAGLGEDGRGYVFEDLTCRETPKGWAQLAIRAYQHYRADRIVAEGNNGGDLIETVMRGIDVNVPFTRVHARVGKFSRAEPVAALYEQGRVSHVGAFHQLEDECCEYDPTTAKQSPNRMDALVWALTELMLSDPHNLFFA